MMGRVLKYFWENTTLEEAMRCTYKSVDRVRATKYKIRRESANEANNERSKRKNKRCKTKKVTCKHARRDQNGKEKWTNSARKRSTLHVNFSVLYNRGCCKWSTTDWCSLRRDEVLCQRYGLLHAGHRQSETANIWLNNLCSCFHKDSLFAYFSPLLAKTGPTTPRYPLLWSLGLRMPLEFSWHSKSS